MNRWWGFSLIPVMASLAVVRAEDELVKRWEFKAAGDAHGWAAAHDLKDFAFEGGVLRMTIAGVDAFFIGPSVSVPLDGCVVRLRLRADREGWTEVYWRTSESPQFGEKQVVRLQTPVLSSGFTTLEFPIGSLADCGRTLTGLRIDPCNGNGSGSVEVASIELLRAAPVIDVDFAASSHHMELSEEVPASVRVRQVGGRSLREPLTVEWPDGQAGTVTPSTRPAEVATVLHPSRAGVQQATTRVRSPGGLAAYSLATSYIVGKGDRLPLHSCISASPLRLDLVPMAERKDRFGAARWMMNWDGRMRMLGWLMPLGDVTIRKADGQIARFHPAMEVVEKTGTSVRLAARIESPREWRLDVRIEVARAREPSIMKVVATLTGPEGGELLDFSAPSLLAERDRQGDLLDRHAVFGGLEFLEPGWRSSSDRAVGETFADRWAPHPFKITVPVMAVEAQEMVSSILWPPLQTWNGRESMPTATFASPNFLAGQPNHLMKLSVPTIPRWRRENESIARTPYIMKAGQPLRIEYVLFSEGKMYAGPSCRVWYDVFEPPAPPPPTHDDRQLYDLVARNYGETMYWPAEKGWRHHWWHTEKSSGYVSFMAGFLLAHAADTGEKQWVERAGLSGRNIIDAVGTLATRVAGDAHPFALVSAMRPDGTWPFVNPPEIREQARQFTGGKHDSLGDDNSTSVGTCAQAALPILRYALLTGDPRCVQAGMKALEAMRQFSVPRGAQVWEVHQDIPDLRAASLAVEAYRIGYQLTGHPRWLDEAAYWAYTGLPFIYSWPVPVDGSPGRVMLSTNRDTPAGRAIAPLSDAFEVPARQIMPFASLPVLGPTFYVINWYGVVVQWVGMEWASEVLRLCEFREDPLLRRIADGVVASGLQQMFDKPPWVGLYPDVWDTQTNTAQGAFISSMLPMQCLQAQGRIPSWSVPWTRVLRPEPGSVSEDESLVYHASGWGTPTALDTPHKGLPWNATVEFLAGQPSELILAGVEKPRVITVDAVVQDELNSSDPPTQNGWRYDAARRVVLVRFVQDQKAATIRVEW